MTEEEIGSEEEAEILFKLQETRFSVQSLLDTMDTNLSLLEGSIREVRTAHQIAAESNRIARRHRLRENSATTLATSK